MIFVDDKEIVVPGDVLADEEYHSGRGTFREDNKICSSLVGLVAIRDKKISVIPLQSKYIPRRGDVVIGEITDIRFSMMGIRNSSANLKVKFYLKWIQPAWFIEYPNTIFAQMFPSQDTL